MKFIVDSGTNIGGLWNFEPIETKSEFGVLWLIATTIQDGKRLDVAVRPRNFNWSQVLADGQIGVNLIRLTPTGAIEQTNFVAIGTLIGVLPQHIAQLLSE